MSGDWQFYGRQTELDQLRQILSRRRWFFLQLSGRRRIGKTTLIQRVLPASNRPFLYVQIPDSAPAGVLSAYADAAETFDVKGEGPPPKSLRALAQTLGGLMESGYVVALDEFQYFNRKVLSEFTSHLQEVVDALSRRADEVSGGLIVLGSLHAEMMALLEDRTAPLYARTTDELQVGHLDIQSLLELLEAHADQEPERLLFLWNLFEGVPKFYRDCFEQGVLGASREQLLESIFFRSSSPLRHEAENWFLKELRGRYDVVLKYIARYPGCNHGELQNYVGEISTDSKEQVAGYIKNLSEKFQMIERKLPVFATPKARRGRFYIRDNFLRSWLAALQQPVAALNFKPVEELVGRANERLQEAEGHGFERLVRQLYEERSRKGLGDFSITAQVQGYWDGGTTEIDLVALNDEDRVLRFGTCKRSASKLAADVAAFEAHVARFRAAFPRYESWTTQRVALAPVIPDDVRKALQARGLLVQDLADLCAPWICANGR